MEKLKKLLPGSNGVILSDYIKGMFTKEIIENCKSFIMNANAPCVHNKAILFTTCIDL